MQYHLITKIAGLCNLVFCLSFAAFAQPSPADTSAQRMAYLDKLASTDACIWVLDELNTIRHQYPKYAKTAPIAAKALFQTKDYDAVTSLLLPISKKNPGNLDAHSKYLLAVSLYRTNQFDECLKQCLAFERMRQRYDAAKFQTIKSLRNQIAWRSKLDSISSPYTIDSNFAFPNSAYADFSPYILNDTTLIFSSLRSDSLVTHKLNQANFGNVQMYRYSVSEIGLNEITQLRQVNKLGYESANGMLTADKREFYFTRCTYNFEGKRHCKLYSAQVATNGDFQKVKPLPEYINKAKYTQSQPMVTYIRYNGGLSKVLFFVSNRKGGFGGTDIWCSVWNEKKKRFGRPANLGIGINTAGNENSPQYDSLNNAFYFSSDGHPGYGGMDIFSADMKSMVFKNVRNMGKPINSAGDDHYFVMAANQQYGFFASNRAGANKLNETLCCEDIFRFEHKDKQQKLGPEIIEPEPIASLEPMKFLAGVIEHKPESSFIPEPVMVNDSKGTNSESTEKLQRISQRLTFETNSSKIKPTSLPYLDSLALHLKENKIKKLKLIGHTDDIGSASFNLRLSKSRVETVVQLLRLRGIPSERIESSYVGMQQPLLPNRNPDGRANAFNQSKNRRVTIIVEE